MSVYNTSPQYPHSRLCWRVLTATESVLMCALPPCMKEIHVSAQGSPKAWLTWYYLRVYSCVEICYVQIFFLSFRLTVDAGAYVRSLLTFVCLYVQTLLHSRIWSFTLVYTHDRELQVIDFVFYITGTNSILKTVNSRITRKLSFVISLPGAT